MMKNKKPSKSVLVLFLFNFLVISFLAGWGAVGLTGSTAVGILTGIGSTGFLISYFEENCVLRYGVDIL